MTRAEAETKIKELQAELDAMDDTTEDVEVETTEDVDAPETTEDVEVDTTEDVDVNDSNDIIEIKESLANLTDMLTTFIKASHSFRESTIDEAYEKADTQQKTAEEQLKEMIKL